MSNDPVAQGLAMLSSTPFSCLPKTAEEITKNADMSSDVLVVLTAALSHCHYWDYPALLFFQDRKDRITVCKMYLGMFFVDWPLPGVILTQEVWEYYLLIGHQMDQTGLE